MRRQGFHVHRGVAEFPRFRGRFRPGPAPLPGGSSGRVTPLLAIPLSLAALLSGAGCGGDSPTSGGLPAVCDDPGVICTVAGTGLRQFDGDGRQARETSLYNPLDVEFDRRGRPLILDWNNLRVRRINGDGTVETVIGQDFEGAAEDGALAVDTPLHHPGDLEIDAAGNIYIASNHISNVIRLGVDDRVSVVAGTDQYGYEGDDGPALEAVLAAPFGVLPAGDGGFFISDTEAHVVRHVDAAGIITTVAGNGSRGFSGDGGPGPGAQLDGPTRLRLDWEGRLYICDTRNHRIRRLDADGSISTVAGTGDPGFAGDGGPALEAQLNSPFDLRFAGGGLYVADAGNNAVRRIGADGAIATVVGTGEAGFSGDEGDARRCMLNRPSAIAFASDGSLWIADTFNQRIRRVAGFLEERGG